MSEDLNTEIKMSVNAEGVETGVTRAKRSIEDLGTTVDNVGKRGTGLNRLGAEGEIAGRKIDQVTKNMVASLQRQIAAAEAGGTATRQYQESIARLRGANMNVLGPYLDQLEAARAKTEDAERAVNGMAGSIRSLSSYIGGVAGGLAAYFSLRTFIDETIAAEQEQAQLAAVLRSTGEAAGWSREQLNEMAEALSSKGGKSLLSAGEINQAQARLLSYSNVVGEVFPRAMQSAIDMAQRMGMDVKSATETIGKALDVPSEGLTALTKQGFRFTESQKQLVEHLEATGRTAQAQGIILAALEASYGGAAEAARNTLGGSLKALRNTVNDLMTGEGASITSMRKGIEDLNSVLGAASTKEAFQSFTGWIASVSAAAVRGTANLMTFMGIVAGRDTIANGKRDSANLSARQEWLMKDYEEALELARFDPGNLAYTKRVADLRAELDETSKSMLAVSDSLKGVLPPVDWSTRNASAATDPRRVDLQQPALVAPTKFDKKAAEELRRELAEQAKLIAELAGLSSTFYEDWERLNRMFREGALSVDQLTAAQGKLLEKQPAIKAENERIAKEQEAALKAALHLYQLDSKAQEQLLHQRQQLAASTEDAVRRAQDEAQAHAMAAAQGVSLADAIAQIALARAEEAYQKELSKGADAETLLALQKEVQARKELLGLIRNKAARDAAEDAAKKAAQEWERTAEQINQSLTDALMRGFEDGKGFAANLRDTVVNMFKTMVLRPVVSAILMPVAGTITGALGLAGGANAGQGGVLSTVGNIGSGYSLLSGLGAFGGGLSGGVGGLLGSLGLSATGTTLAGALDAGMIALQAGNIAGGLGTLAGALGPIALGLAGLVSVFGGMDRSGTPHWGAAAEYSGGVLTGGNDVFRRSGTAGTYSAQAQAGVDAVAKGVGDTLEAMARAFGRDGGYSVMTAYSDDSSDDPGFGSLRITRDGQKIRDWEDDRYSKWAPGIFADGEEGWKLYLSAIAKDTRQALLDMDIPGWAEKMLTDLGDSVTMEQLAAVVQQIGVINTVFEQLGDSMAMFAGITDDLQGALLEAAGGIDALVNSAGAFYQGFYTDAERMDALRGQLNTALSDLDLSIDPNLGSDAKAQFRTAVENAMASGNAELAAALLAISGNFASAADYFEQLSQTAAEAARKAAEDARRSVYDMFKRAADRDRKDLQAQASSLGDAISGISSAVDLLKSNARDLYGEVDSTAQMAAARGMVYVENALAGVRAGASVADYTGLSDAISAARGGLGSGVYQSEFARQRDTLVLAGQLSELGELGDLQLSVEERQLRAINEQLEYLDGLTARADELINGTVTLTGTVESYFQQLLGQLDQDDAGGGSGGDNGGGFSSGGDATGTAKETPQMRAEYIRRVLAGIDLSSADGKGQLVEFGRMHRHSGYTAAEVARALGIGIDEFERLVGFRDFPAFATGINRVPYDMVAKIHKDEAIIPAAFNPFNPGAQRYGGSDSALVDELRALRKEVAELRLISAVTASNTAPLPVMADQFDSVTEGGNAMRGDAANVLEL